MRSYVVDEYELRGPIDSCDVFFHYLFDVKQMKKEVRRRLSWKEARLGKTNLTCHLRRKHGSCKVDQARSEVESRQRRGAARRALRDDARAKVEERGVCRQACVCYFLLPRSGGGSVVAGSSRAAVDERGKQKSRLRRGQPDGRRFRRAGDALGLKDGISKVESREKLFPGSRLGEVAVRREHHALERGDRGPTSVRSESCSELVAAAAAASAKDIAVIINALPFPLVPEPFLFQQHLREHRGPVPIVAGEVAAEIERVVEVEDELFLARGGCGSGGGLAGGSVASVDVVAVVASATKLVAAAFSIVRARNREQNPPLELPLQTTCAGAVVGTVVARAAAVEAAGVAAPHCSLARVCKEEAPPSPP